MAMQYSARMCAPAARRQAAGLTARAVSRLWRSRVRASGLAPSRAHNAFSALGCASCAPSANAGRQQE